MNEFVGVISVLLSVWGYSAYIGDTLAGRTKPHAFTWFGYGSITAVVFAAQISEGAGPGAWMSLVTAVVCVGIFLLALRKGEKDIRPIDKLNLAAVFAAIGLWLCTSNAVLSVVLLGLADLSATMPTIRKSWNKPYQETLIAYNIAIVRFLLSIIALSSYTFVTVFPPMAIIAVNVLVASILVYRRRAVGTAV